MTPDAVEDAIVARLLPFLSPRGVDVIALPDDEASFDHPFERGLVTVSYHSSTFNADDQSSTKNFRAVGTIVQRQEADVVLALEATSRRGEGGIFDQRALVLAALVGWKPPGMTKLYAMHDAYFGFENGTWMHTITLRGLATLVEGQVTPPGTPPPTVPLIKTITHEGL